MNRKRWYGLAAILMVCTPVGGLISRAFARGAATPAQAEPMAPFWFSPARLLMLGALVLVLTLLHYRARATRKI
ncbi:MAG: hypothetical protein NTV86_05550 [Planctomycetota bacterium]|nr:hypothetical protein [Planctomycetota bacterium]